MAYAAKACTRKSYRRNTTIILAVLTVLSAACVGMLIFSFISGKMLYGFAWLIAFILLASYVLIRRNTVFPTYLATDKQNVYMNTWNNDFLPYDALNKIKIVREFIPAKTKLIKIPIEKIDSVIIGTKNSIKKYSEESADFREKLKPFEKSKDYYQKKLVSSTELFFVTTEEGSSYFMPIDNFSQRDVSRVLQFIQRLNPDISINISSKNFRMSLKKK